MPFRSYATSLILLNNPLASSPLTTQYAAHLPSLRLFKLVIYKLGPAKSNTGIGLATICRVAEATQPSFMELHYEGRAQGAPLEFSPKHRQHTLVLRNSSISSTAVLFKVQCTAPRRFRVRPALGLLIASGDTVNIQVQLRSQVRLPGCRCCVHRILIYANCVGMHAGFVHALGRGPFRRRRPIHSGPIGCGAAQGHVGCSRSIGQLGDLRDDQHPDPSLLSRDSRS